MGSGFGVQSSGFSFSVHGGDVARGQNQNENENQNAEP